MNSAYIGKLMEIAQQDHNVVHLLADSGTGYDEMFRKNFPDQMYNFGIAEENMVSAAAGMATVGKIPFAFTQAHFWHTVPWSLSGTTSVFRISM